MAFMNKKISLTMRLPQLQNFIKRDPDGYKEEFMMQKRHFDSELEIFKMRPTKDSEKFSELVTFMCHVAACYKNDDINKELSNSLIILLEEHAMTLNPDIRAKLFQSLILLRNKNVLDPLILLKLSFKLFSVPDKPLRISLCEYIINDIKTINANKHNDKLNRSIQALLYNIVNTDHAISARKTVEILSELYRRRVWTDARTVNVIASACLSPLTRVFVSAINFFLGIETQMYEDEEDEKTLVKAASNPKETLDLHSHSKKTRKRIRQVKHASERQAKLKRSLESKNQESIPLFPAIQLINDPQELSETLFKKLRATGERFEVKLLLMNFISRLIGCHRLLLLSFYSFLQKYLTSHQQNITKILAYLIQSCHELVPPEELLPIIKAIAYNFITERCPTEIIAIGINSVREIMTRVPSVLREPGMDDFIQDLIQYSKKSHKSVMIASHSILNFVRESYPALLKRGNRGKYHDINSIPVQYGELRVTDAVAGTELLQAYEQGDVTLDDDNNLIWKSDNNEKDDKEHSNDDDDDDDEEEEIDDDEDGWQDVDDDDDENDDDDDENDDDDEDDDDDDDDEDEADEQDSKDEYDFSEWKNVEQNKINNNDTDSLIATTSNEAINSNHHNPRRHQVTERIEAKRLLTEADFELLARLREAQKKMLLDPKNRSFKSKLKQSQSSTTNANDVNDNNNCDNEMNIISSIYIDNKDNDDNNDHENGIQSEFAMDPESLGPASRVAKTTKIERIQRVLEGRGEKKFKGNEGHAGGLTNKEKERKKNYIMVRKGKQSVTAKLRKSNSEVRYEKMHSKKQFGRERRKRRRT